MGNQDRVVPVADNGVSNVETSDEYESVPISYILSTPGKIYMRDDGVNTVADACRIMRHYGARNVVHHVIRRGSEIYVVWTSTDPGAVNQFATDRLFEGQQVCGPVLITEVRDNAFQGIDFDCFKDNFF